MIELVFVIVVLGILAAVAVPRISATRTDAQISKGAADVSAIRSGIISERQARLITGDSAWITIANLDNGNGDFFGGVLMYGIGAGDAQNGWVERGAANDGLYTFNVAGSSNHFDYNQSTGLFLCTNGTECNVLTGD